MTCCCCLEMAWTGGTEKTRDPKQSCFSKKEPKQFPYGKVPSSKTAPFFVERICRISALLHKGIECSTGLCFGAVYFLLDLYTTDNECLELITIAPLEVYIWSVKLYECTKLTPSTRDV